MLKTIRTAEDFSMYVKEYPRKPDGNNSRIVRWGCIDDRPTQSCRPQRQTAGGVVGLGQDLGASMIMHANRERQKLPKLPPAHILGAIAAQTLRPHGIVINIHEGCKAEGSARAIRQGISENRVHRRANQIARTGMSSERYRKIVRAFDQLELIDEDYAAEQLDKGTRTNWHPEGNNISYYDVQPVRRAYMSNNRHVAKDVLFNYSEGKRFDTEEAFWNGAATYHISLGDMTELTTPLQEAGFAFDESDFIDVTTIRHAATSFALPHAEDEPLNVHILR